MNGAGIHDPDFGRAGIECPLAGLPRDDCDWDRWVKADRNRDWRVVARRNRSDRGCSHAASFNSNLRPSETERHSSEPAAAVMVG